MSSPKRHVRGALLLYHRPALFPDAATISDHINAFERYSRFPFWKLNTDQGFPRRLAALSFDLIVVHYSVFASGPAPYMLDEGFLGYLDAAERSYKLAFFQDEHQYCQKRFAFLDRYRFDCVYTCIEPEYFDQTYRRYTRVPTLVSHVPAYVHPHMLATAESLHRPDGERDTDIGYRARPTPPFFGRGGMEKVEIAERFRERAAADLRLDVSVREQDRLYGDAWYRFMARCKGFLGTESGASCVDLEDEVREEYEALLAAGENPTIERLEQGALGRWDWKVPLRTTSSRHFEAAALRICQVMYEGRYSGALRPMEHYIPLKKDLSNFDEVIEAFRDPAVRRELAENAHRDLIASGDYSYERFIAGFDQALIDAGLSPPGRAPDPAEVQQQLGGRSIYRAFRRYIGGATFWLYRRYPRIWRFTVPPLRLAIYIASRPIVWPTRQIARLVTKRRSATAP
ncbi:MAG: hypothetical protein ACRDL6_05370 [Solirubrobacterales bacterium]